MAHWTLQHKQTWNARKALLFVSRTGRTKQRHFLSGKNNPKYWERSATQQRKKMNIIMVKRGLSSFSCSLRRLLSSTSTPFPSSTYNLVPTTASDVDAPQNPPTPVVKPVLLQPRVVVYDGVCHLCHRGVKWVIRADKDKKLKFCCVQSDAAEPYLRACGLEREDVLRRFLFIEGLNVYSQGSTAALRVLSYLPLPYSALSSLWVIPTPIRDAVYDYVARQRYEWFGKAEECLVLQEKELLERFIDREEMMNRGRDL